MKNPWEKTCQDAQQIAFCPCDKPPKLTVNCYKCRKSMSIGLPSNVTLTIQDVSLNEALDKLVCEWGKLHPNGEVEFLGRSFKKDLGEVTVELNIDK